jgi:hypothetical protein
MGLDDRSIVIPGRRAAMNPESMNSVIYKKRTDY